MKLSFNPAKFKGMISAKHNQQRPAHKLPPQTRPEQNTPTKTEEKVRSRRSAFSKTAKAKLPSLPNLRFGRSAAKEKSAWAGLPPTAKPSRPVEQVRFPGDVEIQRPPAGNVANQKPVAVEDEPMMTDKEIDEEIKAYEEEQAAKAKGETFPPLSDLQYVNFERELEGLTPYASMDELNRAESPEVMAELDVFEQQSSIMERVKSGSEAEIEGAIDELNDKLAEEEEANKSRASGAEVMLAFARGKGDEVDAKSDTWRRFKEEVTEELGKRTDTMSWVTTESDAAREKTMQELDQMFAAEETAKKSPVGGV